MTAKRQFLRVAAVALAVVTGLGAVVVSAAPAWAISPRIDASTQVPSQIVAGGEGRVAGAEGLGAGLEPVADRLGALVEDVEVA